MKFLSVIFLLFAPGNSLPSFTTKIPRERGADAKEITLSNITRVARMTGKPVPGENLPAPNRTAEQYDVGGTDLGIFWTMGDGRLGVFFGDTHGREFTPVKKGGGNGKNWRSNVLAFSRDTQPQNGITFDGMAVDEQGAAREICAGGKAQAKPYQTSIPTAAIHANGVDYVHYMNIREWNGGHGRWLTNFSSLYASHNNGKDWERKREVTFGPESNFSQVCYARKGAYVYMIGTLAGRGSPAYLARIPERCMLKPEQYEYWNGNRKTWVKGNEKAATIIIPGPVGEASLLYHKKFKRWIIAYSYDSAYEEHPAEKFHALVYRDAAEINGTWSKLKILSTEKDYAGLYCPYFYPLKNDGDQVYYSMSMWEPYNVFLMRANISLK